MTWNQAILASIILRCTNIGQRHTTLYQYWPASYYAVPILASIILRCTNIGQRHTTLYQYWPASYYAVPILASIILRCTNIGQRHTTLYQYWPASFAEWHERSERSKANTRGLFETPRYLFIYIYIYICLSARALHKTVHTLSKSYYVGPLCIVLPGTLAAVWSTTLRTRPFNRYGLRCQFS